MVLHGTSMGLLWFHGIQVWDLVGLNGTSWDKMGLNEAEWNLYPAIYMVGVSKNEATPYFSQGQL